MKKLIILIAAIALTIPTMAQFATGGVANNPAYQVSAYETFLSTTGRYTKHQVGAPVLMKLVSTATLGGYTIRAEKTTNLVNGGSKRAVSIVPNSATGIGKFVSKSTGIGSATQSFYLDYSELAEVKKAIARMKEDSAAVPALYTRYTYVSQGGFAFSVSYLIVGKKALWVGQVGETGEMPLTEFFTVMTEAFTKAELGFANFK